MTARRAPVRRRAPAAASKAVGRFVVLTGLSGAGKSQAIRALEDLGYFCVDNLPTTLIPTLAELSRRAGSEIPKVAIVVDVREGAFLSRFPKAIRALKGRRGIDVAVIFLEASDDALVRRFSETRRPHPLAKDRPVVDGIREERERLAPIRAVADQIVDTTDLTVHELREAFMAVSRGHRHRGRLLITFLSFGFKHGVPVESDLLFDVRCLPNPHFVPELRARTGRERPVIQYMESHEETLAFVRKLEDFLRFVVPHYVAEGKSYLTVGIGCTGGRHRSVMMAESLRRALGDVEGIRLRVRHRDIDIGSD
ncbi:MAG: RNase adapter RapZ [Acidobacteria bacterium]|nr:MAG: RNase adapter RapZ [Acidobacteriota bacterium]